MLNSVLSLFQKSRLQPPLPPRKVDETAAVLDTLHAEFDRLNSTFFGSRLTRPTVEFSRRKTFGGYYQKQRHRIVLSWQAFLEHGMDETLNTFRHEVAHIVHQHHKQEFWELARQLGVMRKYAASPLKRTQRRTRWYTYACPGCRKTVLRRRRILKPASCAQCDSAYNPLYRLRLINSEIK